LCIDFCCCCDPCLHDFVAPADVGGVMEGIQGCPNCCKCVPKGIIARFTPDTETPLCRERAFIMWGDYDVLEHIDVIYSATIPGAGLITVSVGKTEDGAGPCAWVVEALDLGYYSEEILLNHRSIKCSRLPALTPIEISYGTYCEEVCSGTITFELYEPEKLPFRHDDFGPETAAFACGDCTEVCTSICVRRRLADGSGSGAGEIERHTFGWDEADQVWRGGKNLGSGSGSGGCSQEEIRLVEVDGVCYLEIVAFEIETFEGDLISLNACGSGMNVEAEDEDGNWIGIFCGRCTCWDYLCGQCRCACPELCIIGGDGNTPLSPRSLAWDATAEGWVDGSGAVEIAIQPDPDSCEPPAPCQFAFDGFDEAVTINEICGNNLSVSIVFEDAENDYAGFKWRAAWCSLGNPCDVGSCLSLCDNVIPIIYCDVTSEIIDPIDNCVSVKCIADFTIPLYLMRNPPLAASEYQWIGYYVYDCELCTAPGGTVTKLIQVVVGCDGTVTVNGDVVGSIRIPCLECDDPLDELLSASTFLDCCEESSSLPMFHFTE
jgi:hypothetical protein